MATPATAARRSQGGTREGVRSSPCSTTSREPGSPEPGASGALPGVIPGVSRAAGGCGSLLVQVSRTPAGSAGTGRTSGS